jgi:hypothetical protein
MHGQDHDGAEQDEQYVMEGLLNHGDGEFRRFRMHRSGAIDCFAAP